MQLKRIQDKDLLLAYQKGNEQAFESLVDKYKNRVYNTILYIVKDPYIAEDLSQETFIKVVQIIRKRGYKEKERFHYWIQRVAHNLAIDHFRKQKRSPLTQHEDGLVTLENSNFTNDSMEAVYIKRDTRRKLHQCMRTLPENQRKVLVMRHYMKMSFQDIADEMGTSINTALGRMRYALISLRKQMVHAKKYATYTTVQQPKLQHDSASQT